MFKAVSSKGKKKATSHNSQNALTNFSIYFVLILIAGASLYTNSSINASVPHILPSSQSHLQHNHCSLDELLALYRSFLALSTLLHLYSLMMITRLFKFLPLKIELTVVSEQPMLVDRSHHCSENRIGIHLQQTCFDNFIHHLFFSYEYLNICITQ